MRDLLINVRNAATRSSALVELPRLQEAVKVIIAAQPYQKVWNVIRRVGCIRSSDEVAVMAMEPRGAVIQC